MALEPAAPDVAPDAAPATVPEVVPDVPPAALPADPEAAPEAPAPLAPEAPASAPLSMASANAPVDPGVVAPDPDPPQCTDAKTRVKMATWRLGCLMDDPIESVADLEAQVKAKRSSEILEKRLPPRPPIGDRRCDLALFTTLRADTLCS